MYTNEEDALKTCTDFINYPNIRGYFPFHAANFLVRTGKYYFHNVTCWGYVLGIKKEEKTKWREN